MAWYNDWDDFKSGASGFLFGGNATKGMSDGPATGAYQTDYLKNMLGRGAPQMNTGQSDQARGQQQNLATMLQGVANGSQVGAGEMAVNRQVGQAQANQQAQAQMARGANAALAARTAARTTADVGVNGAGMAAQAQMQDATNAQGQLGSILNNMRGADIGVANANLGANMQQQQIQLSALAQMLGIDEATLRQQAAKAGINVNDKGAFGSMLQAGAQMVSAKLGASGKADGDKN